MPPTANHHPVLLSELILGLAIQPSGIYIDATFGRGGHSQAILAALDQHGQLYAFDQDPAAVVFAKKHFAKDSRFHIFHSSFTQLKHIAQQENIAGKIAGIALDLGVSSPQLDEAERGFSFRREGPLDMRMDPSQGQSAAAWLAKVKESTLAQVLAEYGEERFAKRIAKAIALARQQQAITTTTQLAEIIAAAHPAWPRDKHPATQSFQALRIFINQELEALTKVLPDCLQALRPGGRLAVISFHSLEDRIVKQFIKQQLQGDAILNQLPVPDRERQQTLRCIGRVISPSMEEIKQNPRARSAKLRIVEKLA